MNKILIVDDDVNLQSSVAFSLEKSGFRVTTANDGQQGLERFHHSEPNLVILDILMPKLTGIELCKKIRAQSDVPIIFLTSVSDEIDKVVGLELGADDYVTKPFSPRELVARVKVILRRTVAHVPAAATKEPKVATLQWGKISLNTESFRVLYDNHEIKLTALEIDVLRTFLQCPQKVFSRNNLMDHAYPSNTYVSDRTIDSHIRKIRAKFKVHQADPIETVHGIGYKLAAKDEQK